MQDPTARSVFRGRRTASQQQQGQGQGGAEESVTDAAEVPRQAENEGEQPVAAHTSPVGLAARQHGGDGSGDSTTDEYKRILDARITALKGELAMARPALQQYLATHGSSAEFEAFQGEVQLLEQKLAQLEAQAQLQPQSRGGTAALPTPTRPQPLSTSPPPTPTHAAADASQPPGDVGSGGGVAMVTMQVTCPPSAHMGQEIIVTTEWGEELTAKVPIGVGPGQSFLITATPPPPPTLSCPAASASGLLSHAPRSPRTSPAPPQRAAESKPIPSPSSFYLSASGAGKEAAKVRLEAQRREKALRQELGACQAEMEALRGSVQQAAAQAAAALQSARADHERRLVTERELGEGRARAVEAAGEQAVAEAVAEGRRQAEVAAALAAQQLTAVRRVVLVLVLVMVPPVAM
jgi:hypothetical protein